MAYRVSGSGHSGASSTRASSIAGAHLQLAGGGPHDTSAGRAPPAGDRGDAGVTKPATGARTVAYCSQQTIGCRQTRPPRKPLTTMIRGSERMKEKDEARNRSNLGRGSYKATLGRSSSADASSGFQKTAQIGVNRSKREGRVAEATIRRRGCASLTARLPAAARSLQRIRYSPLARTLQAFATGHLPEQTWPLERRNQRMSEPLTHSLSGR
jgi:hypothetical protein